MNIAYLTLAAAVTASPPASAQITGRSVPAPIVGITYDKVSNVSAEVATLSNISKLPQCPCGIRYWRASFLLPETNPIIPSCRICDG